MDVPGDQLLHENVGRRLHDSALVSHIETSNKMLLRSFKLFAGKKKLFINNYERNTYIVHY